MIALSACSWPGVGSMSPARRSWPSPRLLLVASAWRRRCALRRSRSSCPAARSSSSSRAAPAKNASSRAGWSFSWLASCSWTRSMMNRGLTTQMPSAKSCPRCVDVGEASGAGAVAGLRGDLELERLGLGAGGERVELAVDLVRFAGEDLRELFAVGGGEVRAGALDVLGGVEHGAVVDADGVGVLVFDDRAVHERAEVPQRACRAGRCW